MTTDEVRGDTNTLISSFEILCTDPRKYSDLIESDGEINTYLPYGTVPEKIEVRIASLGTLVITNG